jgi:hypothetical protein
MRHFLAAGLLYDVNIGKSAAHGKDDLIEECHG